MQIRLKPYDYDLTFAFIAKLEGSKVLKIIKITNGTNICYGTYTIYYNLLFLDYLCHRFQSSKVNLFSFYLYLYLWQI